MPYLVPEVKYRAAAASRSTPQRSSAVDPCTGVQGGALFGLHAVVVLDPIPRRECS